MGITYNKSFFKNAKSISNISDIVSNETIRNKIADAIAEEGASIASQLYAGTDILVEKTSANEGKAEILAKGDQVAYIEFGTGEYSRGSYPGDLPQSGVPITGNWQYYYPSIHKRTAKSGSLGWFHGKKFHIGQKAGAQMWKTAIETRKVVHEIALSVIRNELKEG